ncbi:NAD(P)/FAD-dependent oxidoreductase [Thalassobacter stenotrophicus]|uniref:D-amino acid dehydrogenase small subunit n=2 Tax=Thalassobacter stenotrophicus TaxID=266809 RepID=A0A0P1EZF8_9RHOB|nr:FAD-binding oxidoreductase [Thalassobacter stenotrophicus]PVZ49574.1 FAD-binding oxidoreductase [Thalassobacter stenotrophicus]CUH60625.1 D-amino acid dehydrogenase small subunit [Thalassobacter stenotrophicus]SHJ37090.1 D-amino-acid dehydrogenase [Thalassobacter stenotrophicus DSM 16310]
MGETVTIIGAGIVGICCALSLQERGVQVRLIDRGEPGQETSFGNAGVISPWSIIPQAMPGIWKSIPRMLLSPDGPLSVKPSFWPKMIPWGLRFLGQSGEASARAISDAMEILCQPSVMLYRRHLAGTGHENLVVDSWYVHAFRNADNANLRDLGFVIRKEKGADLELIGPAQIAEVEPALSPDFKAAVLIKGQARARDPGQIARVLADKARAQGADVIRATITALHPTDDGGWRLETSNGEINTEKLVLAAGVWSAELLRPLGVKMPLAAERGYHVAFSDPGVTLNNSVMDVDAKIVASSMVDGIRVAGSSEFAAVDAPADPSKERLLARQARAMLPDLNPDAMTTWMGRRPSFPDSLPALGPIAGQRGLFAAFGHSHYGLMMAPKTGELIADLAAGVAPNADLSPFAPLRF